MCVKSVQSYKNEVVNGGENQYKMVGYGCILCKLLFIMKVEFFLFSSGFRQDLLAKGGYFIQFCLIVMINQIKSIFIDQNIIKWVNKMFGFDFRLCYYVICQCYFLFVDSCLQYYGVMVKNWFLLNVDMI